MIARLSRDGDAVEALCLNAASPHSQQYMRGDQGCDKGDAGGSVDLPAGAPEAEHRA